MNEYLKLDNVGGFNLIDGGRYRLTGVLRRKGSSVELVVSDVEGI